MKIGKQSRILISIFTCLTILLSTIGYSYAEEPFKIEAKSAILMDAATGEIIYEKNIHEKLAPASITKIMVLLLCMEALDSNKIKLEEEVIVSANASSMGGSQVYLEEGEVQTVEELLKAISLRSANDAAVAISEHLSGSIEIFVQKMNERAKELGMKNTNFKNATGLPDNDHYTTAYDISLMSKELLKYPKVHEWLTLWMSEIKVGKKKEVTQSLNNTNKLIHNYQGANGIKTGFTNDAGYCLSASAKRGNLNLISVVLGCSTSSIRFNESKKLLDYGFANYDSMPICRKDDIIKILPISKGKSDEIKVIVKEDLAVLTKKGTSKNVEKEIALPEVINAPVKKHQKLGELVLKIDGNEVGRVDLISESEIEKASFIDMFKKMFDKLINN
ncbi:D-alanyl-D-alanine carboxypeptidase family protein [Brassicibacter mesophilus]|uniref:D-alanyl-D-alanine carboxypeptidase family protein n=1 Tax=Brassicibacter mesophilus TaxID=745119 RepID=UPI003D23502E